MKRIEEGLDKRAAAKADHQEQETGQSDREGQAQCESHVR
jgi:hypothetical protein